MSQGQTTLQETRLALAATIGLPVDRPSIADGCPRSYCRGLFSNRPADERAPSSSIINKLDAAGIAADVPTTCRACTGAVRVRIIETGNSCWALRPGRTSRSLWTWVALRSWRPRRSIVRDVINPVRVNVRVIDRLACAVGCVTFGHP